MNILLVSPKSPDTFWGAKYALKFIAKKAVLPPLGLLTVAALLPKEWNLKLIDMTTDDLKDDHIRWADYVFISAMYIQRASAQTVISRCREFGVKTVAGGPLFTAVPEEFGCVDHLVLGEAEITLPLFLADLAAGAPAHLYSSTDWADLRTSPVPLWHLVNPDNYAMLSLQYSRGCPFNCDFCDVTRLFGQKSRTKNSAQVSAELDALYALGWRDDVFFVDDNFIGNKHLLKNDVLPVVTEWMRTRGNPFSFNTQASINLADDDALMSMMAKSGFNCVFVGIETPDEKSLAECNKIQNKNRDLVACVKKIQSNGMEVQGGFILGFDSDNKTSFESCIRFIQKSGIVTAMVGLLNAPKGTGLYNRLKKEDRLLPNVTGDNTDFSINFIPNMRLKDLVYGYKHVLFTIYDPRNYYSRVFTFMQNYKPTPINNFKINLADLGALMKSIWKIGVLDSARWHYWRLMAYGLRRPTCLSLAVKFAILGYNFQKLFDQAAARAHI